jgi:hypothetical protein
MKPKAPPHKRMKPSRKAPGHLDDIRRLPCLLSGRPAEAAHLRYADAKHGKPETGMQQKPHDKYTVPLCPELHRLLKGCQHDSDERAWWQQFGIDPIKVALELYGQPRIRMERIIDAYRPMSYSPAGQRVAAILKGAK